MAVFQRKLPEMVLVQRILLDRDSVCSPLFKKQKIKEDGCVGCANATAGIFVLLHELKGGKTKSCGCRRSLGELGISNIAGKRFGRLVALSTTKKRDKKGSVYWHCRCDCGNELDVTEDSLVHGNYRSCGCLKKEIQQDIVNKLHHIDGTCVEWLEKRKHRSDNTSGFRGVYRLKNGHYRAGIGFKKQRYHIGTYKTFEEAVAARLEVEAAIHDKFVQAYYVWIEKYGSLPENEQPPLLFEVEKVNGEFIVLTNIET